MSHTVRRIVRDMRSNNTPPSGHMRKERGATDLRGLRAANRTLVLNFVRTEGPHARVAIAQKTGLSRTTVGSIVDTLLKEGFLREGRTLSAAPNGGRRAILVHFNELAGRILGVDLGRSHLTFLATDLAANVLAHSSGPFDCDLGAEVCLPLLVEKLREFTTAYDIPWDSVVGLGLGIPGPMDSYQHMLLSPPRMPGWHGVDIYRFLRRELKVPIFLGNDSNMGALGERRFGAGQGFTDFAYVKLGTGIGCGLVINGTIYRGSRGSAGELGHITIDKDGPLCDCGNRGCLEAMAGAPYIVADALHGTSLQRRHATDGRANTISTAEAGAASSSRLTRQEHVDVADVVAAALTGDVACRAAIERASELIGVALASLINLFNPSAILLDGSVTRAGKLVQEPIRQAIVSRSLLAASEHVRIAQGELGGNAVALGAVASVLDAAFGPSDVAAKPLYDAIATTIPVKRLNDSLSTEVLS